MINVHSNQYFVILLAFQYIEIKIEIIRIISSKTVIHLSEFNGNPLRVDLTHISEAQSKRLLVSTKLKNTPSILAREY